MKKLLLLITLSVVLHAYIYDEKLLQIHAKIAPRLALMTHTQQQASQTPISITIMYEEGDLDTAERFRSLLYSANPKPLKGRQLQVDLRSYTDHPRHDNETLIFFLDTDFKQMAACLEAARNQQILTMSYNNQYLEYGVIFSLHIGKSVKPYVNFKELEKYQIILDPLLLRISKAYMAEESR